jgi:myosin-5
MVHLGNATVDLTQEVEKSGQSNVLLGLDSFESGQTSFETGDDATEDIELLKGLVTQLERERQNLLLGNREICQELNKIDATKTATVSTLHKIAKENSLLRKELATVREKEDSTHKERERGRSEVQCLVKKVAVLKQALQQASGASGLNASLQQEVTRLTEENLSLLETVEDLRRSERAGYRTPMSPRRRTTPCGADSPRQRSSSSSAKRQITFSRNETSSKLLPWREAARSKLIQDLILELKPDKLSEEVPCLSAHMIYLCLRNCRHVTGSSRQTQSFMDEVTSALQQVVQASSMQLPILTFWLANITRLLSSLHTKQTGQTSSQTGLKAGVSGGIATYDLSVCADDLEAVGQGAYRDLFQLIHNKIQPLVVPGVLECESIPNISSVRPIFGSHAGSHDPNITIGTVTRELSAVLKILHKHHLAPEIIGALMKQTFFMINAFLLNNLLLRRDMCHWSKGIQIRYNLSQLEDWVRGHELTDYDVLSQLQPSVEAAKLLQMKKSTASDAESICELCIHLNPLQVQKLLTMYSPANEFEDRVPASVIRLVAQKNGADSTDPVNLMVNIDYIFPVTFPHSTSSDIDYKTVSLPQSLSHLHYLLAV